ncbi:MAG: tRNA methyl transferase PRC-barrel domain-containing protein [Nanoarchaeota archaeon]
MKPQPKKILLAMSGGVDSSVAAYLLKKQGYEIVGAFMKNWGNTKNDFGECAWRGERRYALKIAAMLEIPLITLDFEKEYKKYVVEKMFKLYKQGITPNPDIDCNEKIKFPLLIKAAKKLNCDCIATGHYSRIKKLKARVGERFRGGIGKDLEAGSRVGRRDGSGTKYLFELHRAKDESKDQSYFLYRLKQKELAKALFPIGNFSKQEIREIAKKQNFPNYDKKSTVGICFIGKINLKKFLQKKIKPKKGIILDPDGNKIGEHDGIYYYTIGQRIGPRFGIEVEKQEIIQKRWYVAKKDNKKNIITAAPEGHDLNFRKEIFVKDAHWINNNNNNNNFSPSSIKTKSISSEARLSGGWVGGKEIKVLSRIRQVGELLPSKIKFENKNIKVTLNKAITGVSEGQAIVLYQETKCIGGGVISFH